MGTPGRTAAVVLAGLTVAGLAVLGTTKGGWDTADPIASVLGAIAGIAGFGLSWYIWRRTGPETDPHAVAGRLAARIARDEEEALRQLLGGRLGALIDVGFTVRASGSVTAPPSPVGDEGSASGTTAPGWSVARIAEFYRRMEPGRLVITGSTGSAGGPDAEQEAGTGKTVAAVLLARDLARGHTQHPHAPVPVRLSAPDWQGGTIDAWLVRHLTNTLRQRPREAEALVAHRLVLPVIDGVDEMDRTARLRADSRAAKLLAAVNDYESAPVVMTCRRSRYKALTRARAQARTAAVITLKRVEPAEARAYLVHRVAHDDHHRALWQRVLATFDDAPAGSGPGAAELRRALDTPWRLTLAATVFQEPDASGGDLLRDPTDMLRLAADGTLDAYLLDNFVSAAIRAPRRSTDLDRPPSKAARLDPEVTWRRLAVLAAHLASDTATGGRSSPADAHRTDLALDQLWRLGGERRVLRVGRSLIVAAPVLVSTPVLFLPDVIPASKLTILAPIASLAAIAAIGQRLPTSFARVDFRRLRMRMRTGTLGPQAAFLFACIVFGVAVGLVYGLEVGFTNGIAYGLIGAGGIGLTSSVLSHTDTDVTDPRQVIRADLTTWLLFLTVITVLDVLGLGLVLGQGLAAGLMAGLGLGLVASPALGLGGAVALQYIAFLWCVRGRLPWRLGRFLHHCRQLGILRTAGGAWQFRHRELQHHLAARPLPPTGR
ncbi:NACHT domain-containing protein [Streptomyces sp. NPDC001273]|uniref:NACHT domain-containing protein n=1 Tax=unclassified Streptomyces TaxID=2593676 RepID=UPI0033D7BF67